MPKIHEVLSAECPIEIDFGNGVVLHVVYDPNEYTADAEASWRATEAQGWAGELAVDFICRLVKDWDLEEDDDEIVELIPERINKVSLMLLSKIMDGIFKDVSEGKDQPNRAMRRASAKKRSSVAG